MAIKRRKNSVATKVLKLLSDKNMIISMQDISKELHIPIATTRNVCYALSKDGVIVKKKVERLDSYRKVVCFALPEAEKIYQPKNPQIFSINNDLILFHRVLFEAEKNREKLNASCV